MSKFERLLEADSTELRDCRCASVLAIVAAVCLAKAFSCFNATVVAFGHRGNDDSESLPIPFSRSAARGLLLTSPPLPPPWSVASKRQCIFLIRISPDLP
jgi:hypothetical protein